MPMPEHWPRDEWKVVLGQQLPFLDSDARLSENVPVETQPDLLRWSLCLSSRSMFSGWNLPDRVDGNGLNGVLGGFHGQHRDDI
jgi:hypothetical protein